MKTNTAPQDYNRRVVIVSQIVKLCAKCGGRMGDTRSGLCCISCGHDKYHDVFEHMADVYRRGLMEQQEEAARWLALSMMPQMDVALEFIGASLNLDAETEAEMNRWIAENEATIAELNAGAYMDALPPVEPRTAKQIDTDEWQKETEATRRTDYPI